MIKRGKNLITKLLFLAMCTSLIPNTIAFAGEKGDIRENVSSNSQATGEASNTLVNSSVTNESDFIFDESTGTILKYKGTDATLIIPSTINGFPVTRIASQIFDNWYSTTSITIPSSVTSIADYAFGTCRNLKNIIVDENNKNYVSVNGVLFNKSQTELVKYPAKKDNQRYVIPSSVTTIRDDAIFDCLNLTSITIPSNVTSIGKFPFGYSPNLENIMVDENNKNYVSVDGILFNKSKTELVKYPEGIKNPSYEIPNGVTNIGNWAFYHCQNLTSVIIPDGVTSIGSDSFLESNSLTSVTIPSSVKSIGKSAFIYIDNAIFYVESDEVKQFLINNGVKENKILLNSQLPNVKISSITLNNTNLNMVVGNTAALKATILPSDVDNKIIWTSSDSNIAEVDENGIVTATGFGTAKIACTATDGSGKSVACSVTVGSNTKSAEKEVQIALKSNSSSLCNWEYASIDDKTDVIEEVSKNFIKDKVPTGYLGGNGTDIWTFKGLKEGSTVLKFKFVSLDYEKVIETRIFRFTVNKELKVTVKEIPANQLIGDVNDDGKVSLLDYFALKKYVSGKSIIINQDNADINQDSKIDSEDLSKLRELI